MQHYTTTTTRLGTVGPEDGKIVEGDFSVVDNGVSHVSVKAMIDGSLENVSKLSSASLE